MTADESNLDRDLTLPTVAEVQAAELDRLLGVIARIRAIDPSVYASSSRDFGRGFAHAMQLVNEELDR